MHIGIIGLGLMGGSLAFALRNFGGENTILLGADKDELVCRRAQTAGAVHLATTDTAEVMRRADLLIFCIYAHAIPKIFEKYAENLRPGTVVSDICGVKSCLYDKILQMLPNDVHYIGIHPMAGKERDGYENADPQLYHGSGFIITPTLRSDESDIALMQTLAGHIGANRVSVADPAAHDAMIAYTSDLMHVASAGLCVHPHPGIHPAFTAGAFRDCTRVADINAAAWAELLTDNSANTLAALDTYIHDLQAIRDALVNKNIPALQDILQTAGDNKRAFLRR